MTHRKASNLSLTPLQINIAGAFVCLTVIAGSGFAVYSSWNARKAGIKSSQQRITQISDELSMAQRDRSRLLNQIEKLESSTQASDTIIRSYSVNELAANIVAMTEEHQLTLEQFQPTDEIQIDAETVQPISMRVFSPYNTVSDWLDTLHQSMPDIHVQSISIQSQSETTSTVITDIRLHWYKPTSPATSN